MELKLDLKKLDDHYSALSDEIKLSGFHKFANFPREIRRYWSPGFGIPVALLETKGTPKVHEKPSAVN
jgi:hypothetical protein